MKKYLIALPLVLIMILSMVPVMAANKNVNVPVKYYKTPDKKVVLKEETRVVEVDEAILGDKAKLEAAVEEAIKGFGFPKLDTDVQPEWTVEVTAKAQTQGAATYDILSKEVVDAKHEQLIAEAKNNGLSFNYENIKPADLKANEFATDKLFTDINTELAKVAKGDKPAEIAIVAAHVAKKGVTAKLTVLQEKAGAVTAAEVSAVAFPKCFVDPKAPVEKWCPELCSQIVVRIWDVANQYELERFLRVYEVDPHKLPTYDGILNHYKKNYFPGYAYQILKTWNNRDFVEMPEWVEKDCVIWINVVPLVQHVNVLHRLMDCCETLDGDVNYTVWKEFWEEDVTVPFIEYQSTIVVNEEKAKEWANTRLQKINATDFVFVRALFDDGINLDGYMTGKVLNLDGNLIDIVYNKLPQITLIYHRVGCDKEEEKVDNATVNNTNTQAPVTASGTQLPATGAKDVTAFFLSAVALLGLGIFFAKKH